MFEIQLVVIHQLQLTVLNKGLLQCAACNTCDLFVCVKCSVVQYFVDFGSANI